MVIPRQNPPITAHTRPSRAPGPAFVSIVSIVLDTLGIETLMVRARGDLRKSICRCVASSLRRLGPKTGTFYFLGDGAPGYGAASRYRMIPGLAASIHPPSLPVPPDRLVREALFLNLGVDFGDHRRHFPLRLFVLAPDPELLMSDRPRIVRRVAAGDSPWRGGSPRRPLNARPGCRTPSQVPPDSCDPAPISANLGRLRVRHRFRAEYWRNGALHAPRGRSNSSSPG